MQDVEEGAGGVQQQQEEEEVTQEEVIAEVLLTVVSLVLDGVLVVAGVLGFEAFQASGQEALGTAPFLPILLSLGQLHFLLSARPFTFTDGNEYTICIRPITLECGRGLMLQMNCRFGKLRQLRESIETDWVKWCFANVSLFQAVETVALASFLAALFSTASPNIFLIIIVGIDLGLNAIKTARFCLQSSYRQICNNCEPSIMFAPLLAIVLSPMLVIFLLQILCYGNINWPAVRRAVLRESADNALAVVT